MSVVVGVDVDGVLADFVRGFTAYGRQLYGKHVPVIHTVDHRGWDDFPELDAAQQHTVWSYIRNSTCFWRMLEPCASVSVFNTLTALNAEIPLYFITNRPGIKTKQQTEGWLADHGVYNPTVVVTADKGYAVQGLGVTHYIDDKAGNAVFTKYQNKQSKVYLLDRPYNQFPHDVLGKRVQRVKTVEEFLQEVLHDVEQCSPVGR